MPKMQMIEVTCAEFKMFLPSCVILKNQRPEGRQIRPKMQILFVEFACLMMRHANSTNNIFIFGTLSV